MKMFTKVATLMSLVLMGCSSSAPQPSQATGLENPFSNEPRAHFFSRLAKPASGTFYVSYLPVHFMEPEDLRQARHRSILSMITLSLEKAGMKAVPLGDAEYRVTYVYTTAPASLGPGFEHRFEILIMENLSLKSFAEARMWEGWVTIGNWRDRDITYLFPAMIGELLKDFPKGN